ncbi:MAG TPA: mechanosensitive ion channel family protein [Burkholderiales bacterium]|nr:mechanosensitive ion channel family protein [Burkholderiales bacterium]
MDEQLKTLDKLTDMALEMAVRFGPKVVVAVLIIVAGYIAGGWVARAAARGIRKFHLEPPVQSLVLRSVRLVVLALFFVMALQNLGVELLPLIAGVGVAGAGIALAMQGVLSNVVAGLTIIFAKPFRVGDYISIVNEEGVVEDISIASTTLGHADLSRVVIPNRKIVGEILHNYGQVRQLGLEVGVAYDSDLDAALGAIREALAANARVLQDPAPVVAVTKLADSAVTISIKPWTKVPDYGPAVGEVNQAVLNALRGKGIDIPFPQREVRVVSEAVLRKSADDRLAGRDAA